MGNKFCHCGQPLHYTDPQEQAYMENLVEEMGENINITVGGRTWLVPRHYIRLHGFYGFELPALGFEEIETPASAFVHSSVPHPAAMINEYLEHHLMTEADLAERSGLSFAQVTALCAGTEPITFPVARALEKVFERPALLWLNLQALHDAHRKPG